MNALDTRYLHSDAAFDWNTLKDGCIVTTDVDYHWRDSERLKEVICRVYTLYSLSGGV